MQFHIWHVHCEDEEIIQKNIRDAKEKFGDNIPINIHPEIRNTEAKTLLKY